MVRCGVGCDVRLAYGGRIARRVRVENIRDRSALSWYAPAEYIARPRAEPPRRCSGSWTAALFVRWRRGSRPDPRLAQELSLSASRKHQAYPGA